MTEITPAELAARLGEGDGTVVLDVRPEAEYADWHVPGSVNVDIADELRQDADAARAALSTLPRDRTVVLAGMAGEASALAADQLRELGHDVRTLTCHRP